MMTSTNCPNCGAPRTGDVCEYCGTAFSGKGPRMDMKLDIPSLSCEVLTDIFGQKYYFPREDNNGPDSE